MSKYESFFVSDDIRERKVALADGTEHTLHFRELPAIEFRKFGLAERSDDDEVRAEAMVRLIAASLCEPDGKPAMTLDQARRLKSHVAGALFEAVLDVNRVHKDEQGNG